MSRDAASCNLSAEHQRSVKGKLIALHTKAEVDNSLQTVEAYTVEIPHTSADRILKYLLIYQVHSRY